MLKNLIENEKEKEKKENQNINELLHEHDVIKTSLKIIANGC